MKVKSLLLTVLAAALFTGCSDSDGDSPDPLMIGRAFLSLSLQSTTGPSTRADIVTEPGSAEESKAGDVKVLLFDEHDLCLEVVTVTGATIGNSSGVSNNNPPAEATEAIAVPPKTAKVFVVINPYTTGWDFTEDKVKNKTWDEINTTLTDAKAENVATADHFMMVSEGDKTTANKGALTDVTTNVKIPDGYTSEEIEAAKNEAKGSPAVVNVDRLASKVTVTKATAFTISPTDAKFTFQGWELSVTNKSVRLYSDLVSYDNKTTGAVYRKDKNYEVGEQPTTPTELRAAFDYLKNIDNTSEEIPEVTRASEASAYCLENTMEAKAQKLGFTTKVVVKAQYTPKDITENTSYFSYAGKFYTLDALKTAYNNTTSGGLKTDLPIFLHKAKLMEDGVFNGADQDAKNKVVAELTAEKFTAKTGIIGRYCAVRYYHESVCYYDVLIRHDKNVEQKMALGRWGVVRNNWYSISLQSVTGPGTPWIPDPSDPDPTDPTKPDPENPTGPDIDDDENDAYLSVKITINPWTFWTQEANLH